MDEVINNYSYNSRIIFFQPALPNYRLNFFDRLSSYYGSNFCVYYSPVSMGVLTQLDSERSWAKKVGLIQRPLPGVEWQSGVLSIPIKRGDIVVISGAPRGLTNLLLLLKARAIGAKTVWWGHFWSSTSKKHRFWLRMMLMRLADSVLFYTDREVDEYKAGFGRNDMRPVSALNNGIDTSKISGLREEYVTKNREKSILFIGRLTDKARLNLLIEALAHPSLSDVTLQVIGDGSLMNDLKSLSTKLGVNERIIWHGGSTDEEYIASVANRCRLFVYPGEVGLSLIHGMAYGLPVFVHDNRWLHMPEIAAFEDEETGSVFPCGDVQGLSLQIKNIVFNYDVLDVYSMKVLAIIELSFNTKDMSKRMVKHIEHFCNGF